MPPPGRCLRRLERTVLSRMPVRADGAFVFGMAAEPDDGEAACGDRAETFMYGIVIGGFHELGCYASASDFFRYNGMPYIQPSILYTV